MLEAKEQQPLSNTAIKQMQKFLESYQEDEFSLLCSPARVDTCGPPLAKTTSNLAVP